ncbi:hypothetical protein G7043_09120 [Lentzea sp. NEAU-D13]|uniref:Uncharacterized protein n=1 Tax=Lentzea alba TaxID=2714351 RepID=A0A7C9RPE4_9PSEU|nr:hypothetical protein [Lentzea alba]NGY59086.1 hypothetical protein [Lentzea alba]
MTKPDDGPGGGTREGFLGDILDKVKDLITDDEAKPLDREDPPVTPQCCGSPTSHPMCQHDSETLLPPPVSGTVD